FLSLGPFPETVLLEEAAEVLPVHRGLAGRGGDVLFGPAHQVLEEPPLEDLDPLVLGFLEAELVVADLPPEAALRHLADRRRGAGCPPCAHAGWAPSPGSPRAGSRGPPGTSPSRLPRGGPGWWRRGSARRSSWSRCCRSGGSPSTPAPGGAWAGGRAAARRS